MQGRIPDPAMLLYSAGQRKLLFEMTDYNRSRKANINEILRIEGKRD